MIVALGGTVWVTKGQRGSLGTVCAVWVTKGRNDSRGGSVGDLVGIVWVRGFACGRGAQTLARGRGAQVRVRCFARGRGAQNRFLAAPFGNKLGLTFLGSSLSLLLPAPLGLHTPLVPIACSSCLSAHTLWSWSPALPEYLPALVPDRVLAGAPTPYWCSYTLPVLLAQPESFAVASARGPTEVK